MDVLSTRHGERVFALRCHRLAISLSKRRELSQQEPVGVCMTNTCPQTVPLGPGDPQAPGRRAERWAPFPWFIWEGKEFARSSFSAFSVHTQCNVA